MSQSPARPKRIGVPPQDGRSADNRLMRRVRAELAQHLGGKPSATQKALIDRAAWLTLYVARIDEKAIKAGGTMSEHDSRQYLAWSNSLTRTLRQLGLKGPSQTRVMTPSERWAARNAAGTAA